MSYYENEYDNQGYAAPRNVQLGKRVRVECSHCHNMVSTNEAVLFFWPDKQSTPEKGLVVTCEKCGSRIMVADTQEKKIDVQKGNTGTGSGRNSKATLIFIIICLLVFLSIGGFAIVKIRNMIAPPPVPSHTIETTPETDTPPDGKEKEDNPPPEIEPEQPEDEQEKTEAVQQHEETNAVYELSRDSGVVGALKKGDIADAASGVWGNGRYRREDIRTIEFHDSADTRPADAWDVSADGNGGIYAWVDSYYGLHIGSNGTMNLSGDCTGLFAYYTGVETIAFNGCLNTNNVTNMRLMFYHCENLRSIDFEGFSTSSAISMDRMFTSCMSLRQLDLSEFDTSNVTDMFGMFSHCQQLLDLDVSSFQTANVKDMQHIFQDCATIERLDISSFDTSKVTSGDSMFYQCYELQTLVFDVNKFDTSNMVSMYAMFARCDNLRSLDVSHFNTSKVTNMAYMFNQDACLNELAFDRFDMRNVTSTKNMLSGTKWQE